jgi:hypothetical protein
MERSSSLLLFFFINSMKPQLLIVFVMLLSMAGCTHSKVVYAKYGRLKLSGQEVNQYPVGQADVLRFQDCCSIESDLIFLNRAITNRVENYDVFISVSELLLQGDFEKAQSADRNLKVLSSHTFLLNKIKVNAYMLQKNESFVARFTYVETKSGLLVIYDVAGKNRESVEGIWNRKETYLDEKIRL